MNESNQLTKQDRDAIIADSVQGMTPNDPPHESVEQQLHDWLPQLVRLRAQGYTPEQLVTIVAKPRIGINTNERTIRRVLAHVKRPGPKPAARKASPKNALATADGPGA